MSQLKMIKIDILKDQKGNIIIMIMSIVLLISSILHSFQLNQSIREYTQSILVPIEILSMTSLLLMNLVNLVLFLKHILMRSWKKLLLTSCVIACSILLMIISMQIDAPTLIYMT